MLLSNPRGANRTVTSFLEGVSEDGDILDAPCTVHSYVANAAIARGAIVMFVAPTATQELRVTPMTSAADDRLFAGVAVESADAAGDVVVVATSGHALALCEDTPAFGDVFTKPTTAGIANTASTDPDATAVVGSIFGTVLGTAPGGAASGLTPVFIRPV